MGEVKILAIDQATTTGWAMDGHSGTWNFKTKADESAGMKYLRFKGKLKEVCALGDINLIVYERAASQYKAALIHGAKMIAVIELFCAENNIEYKAYSAKEIKTFATGKGNAKKEAMISACKKNYGIDPIDDNHADALHIFHLTKHDLGL